MNPYPAWLADLAKLIKKGQTLPLGGFPAVTLPVPAEDAPVVLIFSPHPDDECIVGGLPLRLAREAGWRVVNIGVTCGSKRARRVERIKELRAACDYLDFELEILGEQGLESVTAMARDTEPEEWNEKVGQVEDLLIRYQPQAILFPHAQDWNGTHIGVHHLVMDALAGLDRRQSVYLVETEFWGQNYAPNLMVEVSEKDLSDLISALTFHVGEVQRNPYHLTLPAWMMNSVRLGGETVGGQGAAPPDFLFGTVYRLRRWQGGASHEIYQGGRVVTAHDSVAALFD